MVARLLPEHPALNAGLIEGEIRQYEEINIALAVDTERGLLAPVVRHVDRLGLLALQQSGEALIARAVAGQSRPDDLTGGTFTLTNLGMYEIDGFTPLSTSRRRPFWGWTDCPQSGGWPRRGDCGPADGDAQPQLRSPDGGWCARRPLFAAGQAVDRAANGVAAAGVGERIWSSTT